MGTHGINAMGLVSLLVVFLLTSLVNSRDEYKDGWLYRDYLELPEVPDDIPDEVLGVYINHNNISTIRANAFSNLSSCTFISLSHNIISTIEPGAFNGLTSLTTIWLGWNRLTKLKANVFKGFGAVEKMPLSNNNISEIEDGAFNGLANLKELYLYGNSLTTLRSYVFIGLHSLRTLVLTYNHISTIEVGAFMGLGNLKELWMDHNNEKLRDMKSSTFVGLSKLQILYIHGNKITRVEAGLFNGLFSLTEIGLDDNEITEVQPGAFQGLESLSKLWLFNNSLHTLPSSTFTGLPRPLDITLGANPLQCDSALCWIKRGEKEGWIRWIELEGRPLKPRCMGGVDWDNITLECPTQVECRDPGGLPHGVRSGSSWPYTVGTRINYRCQHCYIGGGNVTCQGDGTWTRRPECRAVTCADPGDVENAVKVPDVTPHRFHACSKHVTYICNHGYHLVGNASLYCQDDGRFSGKPPKCVGNTTEVDTPKVAASTSTHRFKVFDYILWVLIAAGVASGLVLVIGVTYCLLKRKGIHMCYKHPVGSRRLRSESTYSSHLGGAQGEGAHGGGVSVVGGVEAGAYFNKAAALNGDLNYDLNDDPDSDQNNVDYPTKVGHFDVDDTCERHGRRSSDLPGQGGGTVESGAAQGDPASPSTPGPPSPPVYGPESPPKYTRHPSADENRY